MTNSERSDSDKNARRGLKHQAVRLASAELQKELGDTIKDMDPNVLRQKLLERAAANLERMSRNTSSN